MSSRPRILYLTPAWPHDKAHGGQLRALHIGRALQQVGDVRLLVVNAEPTAPDAIARTAAEFNLAGDIKGTCASRSLRHRLDWALNPRCQNVHGLVAQPTEVAQLDRLLAETDLVWFLKLRSANVLNRWRWPRSVMDIDDVPSVFAHATRQTSRDLAGRMQATVHAWIYRRRERLLLERFNLLSVCSEKDRDHLGFRDRVHVIPNGFARPAQPPLRLPHRHPPRLGFMGLYNYAPNFDGVRWFMDRCWPQIVEQVPGICLRLVGTDTDGPLKPTHPSVDGLGWVADPAAEVATWSGMIVPIHTGAGTRIKIVDAFSRQCPVVSTTFGAYGYPVISGKHLLLADDPADFADACIHLVRRPEFARQLADTAWQAFLDQWTWDAIAPRIHAVAEDCLRRTAHTPSVP